MQRVGRAKSGNDLAWRSAGLPNQHLYVQRPGLLNRTGFQTNIEAIPDSTPTKPEVGRQDQDVSEIHAPCLILRSYPASLTAFDTLAAQAQAFKAILMYDKVGGRVCNRISKGGCMDSQVATSCRRPFQICVLIWEEHQANFCQEY